MRAPFSHINQAWSTLILERLHDQGVRDVCIAPGSRSAPLALAAAHLAERRDDLVLHTHFDERGLGFLALGLTRASGRPTALITTSGTAVPNLHPALVEAFQTHQPLIALTADRPPELIHCGANQAIEQPGLFALHVRAQLNLPPPDTAISAGALGADMDQCLQALHGADRGPVHINAPFREPLYGTSQLADFGPWLSDLRAPTRMPPIHEAVALPRLHGPVALVAGQLDPDEAEAVLALAQRAHLPILADIGSQLRLIDHPCVVPYPDLLCASPSGQHALAGLGQVIQFGGRITSKRLNQWLAGFAGEYWLVSAHSGCLDPERRAIPIQANIPAFCTQLDPPPQSDTGLVAAARALAPHLEAATEEPFSELSVARRLSQEIPQEMALFPGNSLSIRLLDAVAEPGLGQRCVTSRGASGIDGLVATAAGFARRHPGGLTLLLGDLSLLHDLNSLALTQGSSSPLVIVVLNNDGGAIFNLLPAQSQGEHFQPLFQLPHGLGFEHAATQFRLRYAAPKDIEAFAEAYQAACQRPGTTLIELTFPPDRGSQALTGLIQSIRDDAARR
ncbi:2-succinyl-5-enolpyruvyl-6-hydroxy-3-cyclohexene-1-carboxylic-acid synthase [Ectothiorhodospira marina]|uniref:2-succinyl-5-enolpyruvyl-6-hydroxy-3-cyclohexene-1-carboxylate synthase n=1 Tax=Ectothiorhodospira marina TaxID=1396821 RepID=A0A1H7NK72_9GAMM|nr:2-succinyl-5-enolpyruvyl-6-hydroxy-3-cyclohexene-1-carboxylic-acid synthase [Ectothiorhodospira marina]SEL23731.1 2-succinyl-5-enolpyruvyl-6-hydroxy-3-cyclohexene-1-carboxylate synthase [Ectothiorhodospira marina]